MYLAESRPLRKPNKKKAIENCVYIFFVMQLTQSEQQVPSKSSSQQTYLAFFTGTLTI
jgi:hypothetical protein